MRKSNKNQSQTNEQTGKKTRSTYMISTRTQYHIISITICVRVRSKVQQTASCIVLINTSNINPNTTKKKELFEENKSEIVFQYNEQMPIWMNGKFDGVSTELSPVVIYKRKNLNLIGLRQQRESSCLQLDIKLICTWKQAIRRVVVSHNAESWSGAFYFLPLSPFCHSDSFTCWQQMTMVIG